MTATAPRGTPRVLTVTPSGVVTIDACDAAGWCLALLDGEVVLPDTFTLTP